MSAHLDSSSQAIADALRCLVRAQLALVYAIGDTLPEDSPSHAHLGRAVDAISDALTALGAGDAGE